MLETTLAVPPPPANEAVAVPALTPQEFLFSALLEGPRPAKAVERMAREQHGWPPRMLFKARQGMRVKAIRCGFGPGGYWSWKLPDHMTDKDCISIRVSGAALSRAIERPSIAQPGMHRHRFLPLTTRIRGGVSASMTVISSEDVFRRA